MYFESVRSYDGTLLAGHHAGEGPLPVLLANGLGGTFIAWKPLVDAFRDRCHFYSWDYRGLYRSEAPQDRETLAVPYQARDALAVLDHFGIERAIVCGWSMGVQVALELHRHHADRIAGFILMNGTYGSPLSTAKFPLAGHLLPPLIGGLRAVAPVTNLAVHAAARWRYTVPLAAALSLVDDNVDRGIFLGIAREFAHLDMDLYLETLRRLGDHDAGDVLADVEVPALLIAGDRDVMTPKEVTGRMVREMARAELFVVPRGTHYCLVEYPELIALRVEKFLNEHFPHGIDTRARKER
ncbi:MAG: alpha/beta hydrolase [Deltaproteobacteria bacterium]|nr:MAG: alpha/beta hydrolase [Deltaproteobacteria bacterium]